MSISSFLLLCVLFFGFQAVALRSNTSADAEYVPKHIDFAKYHRTADCCQAKGKKIAIASGGKHSSQCGMEIWEKGGNLVDAATAVAFCLSVERPHSAGLGGGGFMTLHLKSAKDRDYFLDFRETAPHKATRDMYLDKEGKVIPDLSLDGGLAVATPGFVAGYFDAHKKWGKLPWKTILAPSIRLAREGFAVYPALSERTAVRKEALLKDPYLAKKFFPDGKNAIAEGETLKQEDLATTIELIATEGKNAFYQGTLAKKIAAFVQSKNGILEERDLNRYAVRARKPIIGKFHEFTLVTAPPPSSGGALLVQMLNVLDGLKIESATTTYETHLLSEVMKRAYADRSKFLGDPDFYKEPYAPIMAKAYAEQIRKKINLVKATPSKEIAPGEPTPESPDTTHLSLIDSDGNAVSSTITINYYFGAGVSVPGTGIILNDEMDDFSAKPGVKNIFGLLGGEANAIAPLKHPLSSMMPTIVLKNETPILATGAAGGSMIISSVTQVILNFLVRDPFDLKKAVFAPRMHDQWVPEKLTVERDGFSSMALNDLKGKGHQIEDAPLIGLVQSVGYNPTTKDLTAVFDPRDDGGAVAK